MLGLTIAPCPSFLEKIPLNVSFFHLEHSLELFLVIHLPVSSISCSARKGSMYRINGVMVREFVQNMVIQ